MSRSGFVAALVAALCFASRSARAEAAACAEDRVDKLVDDLGTWLRTYQESLQRARAERTCASPTVLCLNRLGELEDDTLPDRLESGRSFSVYVISPIVDRGNVTISTSATPSKIEPADKPSPATPAPAPSPAAEECEPSAAQLDAIKAAALPIARLAAHPGLEGLHIPADSWTDAYWSSASGARIVQAWTSFAEIHQPPGFAAVGSHFEAPFGDVLEVHFVRTEREAEGACIDKRYDIPVDAGRYHLEVALLVPFVFNGTREIDLVPDPSTNDGRIAVRNDWHVTAAVAVDYFPLGRARALGSSFRNCKSRSCIENWLGVQVGAGFGDFPREWYMGFVLQPISGLSLDVGAAFLKGDFLPPGRSEGMQLPPGTPLDANSRYMVRPYFGFSLTLDALQMLDRRRAPIGQFF
jgi:hypothetical protein